RTRKRFPSALSGLLDLLRRRRHRSGLLREHRPEFVPRCLDPPESPSEDTEPGRVPISGETQVVRGPLEHPVGLSGLLPLLMDFPEFVGEASPAHPVLVYEEPLDTP